MRWYENQKSAGVVLTWAPDPPRASPQKRINSHLYCGCRICTADNLVYVRVGWASRAEEKLDIIVAQVVIKVKLKSDVMAMQVVLKVCRSRLNHGLWLKGRLLRAHPIIQLSSLHWQQNHFNRGRYPWGTQIYFIQMPLNFRTCAPNFDLIEMPIFPSPRLPVVA